MIVELDKSDFGLVSNILNKNVDNIEVKSIIDGTNPGYIFTDSFEAPHTAIVWSVGQEGFYFVGNEKNINFNNHLNQFIDEKIEVRGLKANLNRFEFSGETEAWCSVFEKIFKYRKLNISKQYIYKLEKCVWENYIKREVPADYKLQKIDKALLTAHLIKNREFLSSEILRWWSSIDEFLDKSHGYCMITHNEITNYSMGNFLSDNVMTVGVETIEAHRRKGLSQITSEAFIEECFKNNQQVQWECMAENTPSYQLAEKLRFKRTNEYTLYSFPFSK